MHMSPSPLSRPRRGSVEPLPGFPTRHRSGRLERRLTPEGDDDVRHLVLEPRGPRLPLPRRTEPRRARSPGLARTGGRTSSGSTLSPPADSATTASASRPRFASSESSSRTRPATTHHGVASNYLCDLKAGDRVTVTGPTGKHFPAPRRPCRESRHARHGHRHRAVPRFLHHIYGECPGGWSGQVFLFFGVRTRSQCLYRDELEELW